MKIFGIHVPFTQRESLNLGDLSSSDPDYEKKVVALTKRQIRDSRHLLSETPKGGFFSNFISRLLPRRNQSRSTLATPVASSDINRKNVYASVLPTDVSTNSVGGFSQNELTRADYDKLYYLAKYDEDISYAVDNVVRLGNTEITIKFDDSVSDRQAQQMRQSIIDNEKHWYKGGRPMLVNSLLRQAYITGAVSGEGQPKANLSELDKVVLLSPKWVYMKWNKLERDYDEYQVNVYGSFHNMDIPAADWHGVYHKLNKFTYRYIAGSRDEDKPYAISPLLASLEAVCIEGDMKSNLSQIVKRLGLLGFLNVVLNAPSRRGASNGQSAETPEEYQTRVNNYLKAQIPEIEKGFSNGYVVGLKQIIEGTEVKTDFDLKPTTSDTAGAKALFELVQTMKSAGAKQNPVFLGKNFSTTEALAKVLLIAFTAQLTNYQEIVAQFLEHIYTLHLRLQGFQFKSLDVEFGQPVLQDAKTKYEGENAKFDLHKKEYDAGLISQTRFAQLQGYSSPDIESPRFVAFDKDGNKVGVPFDRVQPKQRPAVQNFLSNSLFTKQVKAYKLRTTRNYKSAMTVIAQSVAKQLSEFDSETDLQSLQSAAHRAVLMDWGILFSMPQKHISQTYIQTAYKKFRKDKSVFGGIKKVMREDGTEVKIGDAVFSNLDKDIPTYFALSDMLHMGRVPMSDKFKRLLYGAIEDLYNRDKLPLKGTVGRSLDFTRSLRKQLHATTHLVADVTHNTMNTLRNFAGISYLDQYSVKQFAVSISSVQLKCNTCVSSQQNVYDTLDAYDQIKGIVIGAMDIQATTTFGQIMSGIANEEAKLHACSCFVQGIE